MAVRRIVSCQLLRTSDGIKRYRAAFCNWNSGNVIKGEPPPRKSGAPVLSTMSRPICLGYGIRRID